MTEKNEISKTLKERLDLVAHLENKIRAYRNWRAFVMKDVRALRRRLKHGN